MLNSRVKTRQATALALMLIMVGIMITPMIGFASSHRDSPFISEDPAADNTDVYAFVSTEPGREQYVTLISNFVPLQEPSGGPNFYKLSDFVNYESVVRLN